MNVAPVLNPYRETINWLESETGEKWSRDRHHKRHPNPNQKSLISLKEDMAGGTKTTWVLWWTSNGDPPSYRSRME